MARAAQTVIGLLAELSGASTASFEVSGGCICIKRYGFCLPDEAVEELVKAAEASLEPRRLEPPERFYWPVKGDRTHQLAILLLLAEAYPYPVSLADLRASLRGLGLEERHAKRILHRYYYYHGIAERVGPGLYRLQDWYWRELNRLIPFWRAILKCMYGAARSGVNIKSGFDCLGTIYDVLSAIREIVSTMRSQRVSEGLNRSQKVVHGQTFRDRLKPQKCTINIDALDSYIKETRPSLYESLGGDARMAAEIIAVLYERARRGKPYLAATTPGALHAALADEAARVLGSSSIVAGTLDWDQVRPVLELLSAADIVYAARYGAEFKLRLDRDFMAELEEAGVASCGR